MKTEFATFLLSVQFLTRLPIETDKLYSPERLAESVRYFPIVGLLIGAICAAVFWVSATVFPTLVAVLISMTAGLLLTGGFHEDGLADTFDGIGGGATPESALEIMKDSRLGTYGTLALILVLLLKVSALTAMPINWIVVALIAGHSLSRLSSVLVIATSRYARAEGTAKPVAKGISGAGLILALLTGALAIAAAALFVPLPALALSLLGLALGYAGMRLMFERKLGGYTGDTLGAVQQASEIGFYLGLLAWL